MNNMISWSAIVVGLRESFLDSSEVFSPVSENSERLKVTEDFLVDLAVIENGKEELISELISKFKVNESHGQLYWQNQRLSRLLESTEVIERKLEKIAMLWADYDYPEEWIGFIHYIPNSETSSPEEVYNKFISFVKNQSSKLISSDIEE